MTFSERLALLRCEEQMMRRGAELPPDRADRFVAALALHRRQVPAEPAPVVPRPPCSFEGCRHLQRAGGLCDSHYRQARRGEPLRPLRSYSKAPR